MELKYYTSITTRQHIMKERKVRSGEFIANTASSLCGVIQKLERKGIYVEFSDLKKEYRNEASLCRKCDSIRILQESKI